MNQPMKTNLLGRLHVLGVLRVLSARVLQTLSCMVLAGSLGGCSGAYWGNLIVLGISFGIFYGTLSLGRTTPTRTASEGAMSQSGVDTVPGATTGQSGASLSTRPGHSAGVLVHSVPPPANT